MSRILLPGQMELHYPAHNLFGVPRELTERLIKTTAVIDFARTGLPAKYLIKNPLIRRGRTLVKGIELDSLAEKKFWLGALLGSTTDTSRDAPPLIPAQFRRDLGKYAAQLCPPPLGELFRVRYEFVPLLKNLARFFTTCKYRLTN